MSMLAVEGVDCSETASAGRLASFGVLFSTPGLD